MSDNAPETFLELAQRLRVESATSGTGPASVVGQNDDSDSGRFVNWIRDCWVDIQREHNRWEFLWETGEEDTVTGQTDYDVTTSIGIRELDLNSFYCRNLTLSSTDKIKMTYVPHRAFKSRYGRSGATQGKPGLFTQLPNRLIRLREAGPADTWRMEFEFWRRPQVLVNNTDEPVIPVGHRMVIVWAALIKYAQWEENNALEISATRNYRDAMATLEDDFLDRPEVHIRPMVR